MNWRFFAGCTLAATALTPIASAQLGNGGFDYNRVTSNTYYNGARVDGEENEYFIRNRFQDVANRYQEGYNPLPVRLGAFEALPSLLLSARATDNLFLDDLNDVSDVGFAAEPSVTVQSIWSRHKVGLDARVRHTEYVETGNESATVGGARAFGIVDVTSNLAFGGSVSYRNNREPRVSFGGVLGAAERVESNRAGAEVNALYQRNRLKVASRLSYTDFDFDDVELVDGSLADQDFRDFNEKRGAVRGDYAVTRDWAVVGEVEYIDRQNVGASSALVDRSISGVAVRVGANFELPQKIRGDVLVGYQTFDSDNPLIADIDGVAVRANVRWFPTELTTVRLTAGRDVEDAGPVNASSVVVTRLEAQATHEFRRNLVGFGRVGYRDFNFEANPLSEEEFSVGVGGTWKLNDNAHVSLGYDYNDRSSTIQPFSENSVRLALRLFP